MIFHPKPKKTIYSQKIEELDCSSSVEEILEKFESFAFLGARPKDVILSIHGDEDHEYILMSWGREIPNPNYDAEMVLWEKENEQQISEEKERANRSRIAETHQAARREYKENSRLERLKKYNRD